MRPDPLSEAAARRHELTRSRAVQALRELDRAGTPVTFAGVAQAAGVSRSWLYAQADISCQIRRLRQRTNGAGSAGTIPAGQRSTDASLRARLTTALDRNKQLADENARLRRQLARALGDQRSAGVRSGNDQEGLYSSDKAASVPSATLSTTGLRRSRPCLTRKLKITVKGNMPTLYRQLKKLPWSAIPAVSSVSRDHGRRARRTIKAILAPSWIGFAGAAQVAQLRRTVTRRAGGPSRSST